MEKSADDVILCLTAIHKAVEAHERHGLKYGSVVNTTSLKMLAKMLEHAFYINVHLVSRPDQWLNFSLMFESLAYSGTPQLWQLLNREVARIAAEKHPLTAYQRGLVEHLLTQPKEQNIYSLSRDTLRLLAD